MKKIICCFIVFVLVVTASLLVIAHDHSGNVAEMDVKYQFDEENGLLTVTAGLINITDATGITDLEYDVHYDSSCLSLKEYNVNMPKSWEPLVESEMAEDLSRKKSDGLFMWAIMVFDETVAVKSDNELFLTLVFEVKKYKANVINFEYIYMANGPLDLVSGNSSEIKISFENDTPSIDISDSIPSVPEIVEKPGDVSSDFIDENSDTDIITSSDNNNDIPTIGIPVQSENISDIESHSELSEGENNSLGLYIGIAVTAVILVVAAVLVILFARGKGKEEK